MAAGADQLPRVFQANVLRFFERVIASTVLELPVHAEVITGEAPSMEVFLDRCAVQVDNHTANEACRAFALILDGLFQRQLSRWVYAKTGSAPHAFADLLDASARAGLLEVGELGLKETLHELHEVGNVVRHGDGPACRKLRKLKPELFRAAEAGFLDLAPEPPDSEQLLVSGADLRRYALALARFWGHLDPLPMPMRELS